MAPLPKRKHSKARKGKRRAAKKLDVKTHANIKGDVPVIPHRVNADGTYKGVQIVKQKFVKTDNTSAKP